MSQHVFTYGSLMFPEVWARLVTRPRASVAAVLQGFVREGVRGQSYPGIRKQAGAQTAGRLYLDIDTQELARLDAFEGAEYVRESVTVQMHTPDGRRIELPAQAYRFVDAQGLDGAPWDEGRFARQFAESFYREHTRD